MLEQSQKLMVSEDSEGEAFVRADDGEKIEKRSHNFRGKLRFYVSLW